jgi:hypothetical protein
MSDSPSGGIPMPPHSVGKGLPTYVASPSGGIPMPPCLVGKGLPTYFARYSPSIIFEMMFR